MAWLNFLRLDDYHGWSIAGVAETTPGGFVPSGRNWPSGIPIDLYADRPRLGSRTQGRSPGYGCLRDPWRHRPFDQELAAGSRLPPGAFCVFPSIVKHAFEGVQIPHIPNSWYYHGPRLILQPVLVWLPLFCTSIIDWPLRRRL